MKKLIVFCLLLSPSLCLCHPGKTDKRGGHKDSSTGIWHSHRNTSLDVRVAEKVDISPQKYAACLKCMFGMMRETNFSDKEKLILEQKIVADLNVGNLLSSSNPGFDTSSYVGKLFNKALAGSGFSPKEKSEHSESNNLEARFQPVQDLKLQQAQAGDIIVTYFDGILNESQFLEKNLVLIDDKPIRLETWNPRLIGERVVLYDDELRNRYDENGNRCLKCRAEK